LRYRDYEDITLAFFAGWSVVLILRDGGAVGAMAVTVWWKFGFVHNSWVTSAGLPKIIARFTVHSSL